MLRHANFGCSSSAFSVVHLPQSIKQSSYKTHGKRPQLPSLPRSNPFTSILEPSVVMLSVTSPTDSNGVGLSASSVASRRRRMLDVVNSLHLTGSVGYSSTTKSYSGCFQCSSGHRSSGHRCHRITKRGEIFANRVHLWHHPPSCEWNLYQVHVRIASVLVGC